MIFFNSFKNYLFAEVHLQLKIFDTQPHKSEYFLLLPNQRYKVYPRNIV